MRITRDDGDLVAKSKIGVTCVMKCSSEITGFYKLSRDEKIRIVKERTCLTDDEINSFRNAGNLPTAVANMMAENIVGGITLPLGIATNFLVNDGDVFIPMAIEEPSVIAAASNGAKICRVKGGFHVTSNEPLMIGQIQVVNAQNAKKAHDALLANKGDIISLANKGHSFVVAKDMGVKILSTTEGPMVIVELVVDVGNAMGANVVNTMAEAVAPLVENLTKGKVYLRIISNLADRRLVKAIGIFDSDAMDGQEIVDGIVYAYAFADADPYRSATHNKGIMNGIVAVGLACGQDTRALEAGAHSYAAKSGSYKPLTHWEKTPSGDLQGTLQMPMVVGIVGRILSRNPTAMAAIKMTGAKSASELACIMGAVGLAQNFSALRALASEGIREGQTKLSMRAKSFKL